MTTVSTSAAQAFNIVDKFQDHLRYGGRPPRTLQELLVARAENDYRRRLAEIKAMSKKLAALNALLPALAESGIRLSYRDISTWDGGKTIRILSQILSKDDKLHDALLKLGFREIERKAYGSQEWQVTLKHGRALVVIIDISRQADAPPAAAQPVATPLAASAA
jgi:hypothetical protein